MIPVRVPASGAAARLSRVREAAALAAVTIAFALLFMQVYRAKSAAFPTAPLLLLNPAPEPAAVYKLLDFYPNDGQRRAAADRVNAFLRQQPELPNAGALSRIRVPRPGGGSARLFSAADLAERIKPRVAVRTPAAFRRAVLLHAAALAAAFWMLHALWRLIGFRGDPYLFPIVAALTSLAFVVLVSLRDPLRDLMLFAPFARNAVLACAAVGAVTAIAHFSDLRLSGSLARTSAAPVLDWISAQRRLAPRRYFAALAAALSLSAALVVFGSGPGESSAKVNLGPFQPVEAIRVLLVFFLAGYFAARWEFLRDLKEKRWLRRLNLPRLDHALPLTIAVGLSVAFFFLQKDLGPALVLATLFLMLYAVVRRRVGLVLAGLAVILLAALFAHATGYPRVASQRLDIWLAPWNSGLPQAEQFVQSLWALASGGAWGSGIGAGSPSYVPESHTDLILTAIGEELGFLGIAGVFALFALFFARALRIAVYSRSDYHLFLAGGIGLGLAAQLALIAGGVTGLLPLSGVVTPFLSYGGSATLANFFCAGLLLAISAQPARSHPNPHFGRPGAVLAALFAVFGAALVGRFAWIQIVRPAEVAAAGAVVRQEDGTYAMRYNPRLRAIDRLLARGTIYDRRGTPLATSEWGELAKHRRVYASMGIDIDRACSPRDRRHYPLGAAAFHVLGDVRTLYRWRAANAAFEEKLSRVRLKGYDDGETWEAVHVASIDRDVWVRRYNYAALLPLLRSHMDADEPAVKQVLEADRSLHLSLDARFQAGLTQRFGQYMRANGWRRGAVVVMRPATGEVLGVVTIPLPHPPSEAQPGAEPPEAADVLDLARVGQYPPGSTFKLVTALAALRKSPELREQAYVCLRLDDGRAGAVVRGRFIRDDVLDKNPHGRISLWPALVHSCNAYFSQLGAHSVGAAALLETARLFNIETASPNTVENLNRHITQAAFGQGEVLATPLRMTRVAAAIANGGVLVPVRMHAAAEGETLAKEQVVSPALARELADAMRGVVTRGTGTAAKSAIPIAGKTGTAEPPKPPSHAWFTGYAPYGAPAHRQVAFTILVEHGRYGGRAAAPFAPEIVQLAQSLKLLDPEAR